MKNLLLTLAIGAVSAIGQGASAEDSERTAAPSSRAEMARTRADLDETIARFDGLDAISGRLSTFRGEVFGAAIKQAKNGLRTFKIGSNDFNKAITTSAIKAKWIPRTNPNGGQFDPIEVIVDFDRKLKKLGIDLIVIPVPSKIEAYAREFTTELPAGIPISTGRVQAMLDLLDQNVEVIDLLPTILGLMTEEDDFPLYETTGHHISGLGVKHCGDLIAEHLERFDLRGRDKTRFFDKKRRSGERITPSVRMFAWQVRCDGKQYEHVADAEVAIIGDSNAFAYGASSMASHIARASGVPVTDLSTSSGASTAHIRLASQGLAELTTRKVVIWVITSTHLERLPWKKTDIPDQPTISGLLTTGRYEEAVKRYDELVEAGETPALNEDELNKQGYTLLGEKLFEPAIAVFDLNTRAFPHSANAWDSLGETCLKAGRKERAAECYKKCLSLNPLSNLRENAISVLKELGVEYETTDPIEVSLSDLEALTGEYALTGDNRGIITVEDGNLVFEFVGQQKMPMEPITDSVFTSTARFTATFKRNASRRGIHVVLEGRSMRFEGKRTEGSR